MRYLGKVCKGKNGETLYPNDADMMYKIDSRLAVDGDFFDSYAAFTIPMVPAYANKDDHFIAYITKKFPDYLKVLEDTLAANGPYICGKEMTIADCSTAAVFFKTSHNDAYEHSLILASIVNKYPKVKAWVEMMGGHMKETINNT